MAIVAAVSDAVVLASMVRLTAEVAALRLEMAAVLASPALPTILTMAAAAHELSVSITTLKGLIRHGRVLTVDVGLRRMVPASEVRRLATPKGAR